MFFHDPVLPSRYIYRDQWWNRTALLTVKNFPTGDNHRYFYSTLQVRLKESKSSSCTHPPVINATLSGPEIYNTCLIGDLAWLYYSAADFITRNIPVNTSVKKKKLSSVAKESSRELRPKCIHQKKRIKRGQNLLRTLDLIIFYVLKFSRKLNWIQTRIMRARSILDISRISRRYTYAYFIQKPNI